MIKEALEYLVGLGNNKIEIVNGQSFSTNPVHLIPEATVDKINVRTLSGLVEYLLSNIDEFINDDNHVLLHVESPTSVKAYGQLNLDAKRNLFIHAQAQLPEFAFDHFYDQESFIIKLQSAFVDLEDRQRVINCCSSVTGENTQTSADDGTKQIVTARTGIASLGAAEVPNPVIMRPFRTFTEVDQPKSEFILRLKDGPYCALFEADGGAWQNVAMEYISDFLTGALDELVEQKKVLIIA